jgi:hypothetical protein
MMDNTAMNESWKLTSQSVEGFAMSITMQAKASELAEKRSRWSNETKA